MLVSQLINKAIKLNIQGFIVKDKCYSIDEFIKLAKLNHILNIDIYIDNYIRTPSNYYYIKGLEF